MAQEIETHLLEKLNKNVGSSKVLAKEFKDLSNLVADKLKCCSSSDVPLLRANLYSICDIFDESQALSVKHSLLSPSVYKIKQKLLKIHAEIEAVRAADDVPNGTGGLSGSEVRSSQVAGTHQVYGFEDEIVAVEKMLFQHGRSDDSFKAIGVVGSGGVGKSTLCQLLVSQAKVKSHFVPRIWIDMSKGEGDSRRGVVERMLDSLGVDEKMVKAVFDEHGLGGLICALHVELMRKRYLIVFDGVQYADDWCSNLNASLPHKVKWEERLAYGLPKEYGGAVIVTSRNKEVTKMMVEEENIHCLLPLSNKDLCWDIFSDEVGPKLDNYPLYEELKKEVIEKCDGIPLAAKMLGQIMKEKIGPTQQPSLAVQAQLSVGNISISQ